MPDSSAPEPDGDGANIENGGNFAESDLHSVSGTIKWFDATRGFGFIVPDLSELGDILVHFSVLKDHGRRMLPEGTRVTCDVIQGARGLQVGRIITLDLSTATMPDIEARPASRTGRMTAHIDIDSAGPFEPVRVKWFNRPRGYGFLIQVSSGDDVFVHMETLRIAGIGEILPDEMVHARLVRSEKGLLAVEVKMP